MKAGRSVKPKDSNRPRELRTSENSTKLLSICACTMTRFFSVWPSFQCPAATATVFVTINRLRYHQPPCSLLQESMQGENTAHRSALTQLVRQHSDHLWLLALLQQGVVEHDALILEEAVPARMAMHARFD